MNIVSSVVAHYETLLAPIYLWMAGGAEGAFADGAKDLEGLLGAPGIAVDLGAGFGMHAIPLARAGYRVLAIDSSRHLLAQLRLFGKGLSVKSVADDLMHFTKHLPAGEGPDLIVCMGDTLTHLPSEEAVSSLARSVSTSLASGGRFVATFRDYSVLPTGPARFIPVRSDSDRILTCFLESGGNTVIVHDILHERRDSQWFVRVSSYQKLRLAPATLGELFASYGLSVSVRPGPRGMSLLVADA